MKHSADDIENTIKQYNGHILRFAYSYLKNTASAEDVSQEVFITYAEKAPFFITEAKKKSWLMTTTANKCKDILRSNKTHETIELTEDLSYMPAESQNILEYVLKLDEKYRVPIHLYYYEGYSLKEIAKLMNSNVQTVGTQLARGRKQLKEIIGDDFNE